MKLSLRTIISFGQKIDWCLEKKKDGELDEVAFNSFIKVVDKYIKDEVDIEWQDDVIIIKSVRN